MTAKTRGPELSSKAKPWFPAFAEMTKKTALMKKQRNRCHSVHYRPFAFGLFLCRRARPQALLDILPVQRFPFFQQRNKLIKALAVLADHLLGYPFRFQQQAA